MDKATQNLFTQLLSPLEKIKKYVEDKKKIDTENHINLVAIKGDIISVKTELQKQTKELQDIKKLLSSKEKIKPSQQSTNLAKTVSDNIKGASGIGQTLLIITGGLILFGLAMGVLSTVLSPAASITAIILATSMSIVMSAVSKLAEEASSIDPGFVKSKLTPILILGGGLLLAFGGIVALAAKMLTIGEALKGGLVVGAIGLAMWAFTSAISPLLSKRNNLNLEKAVAVGAVLPLIALGIVGVVKAFSLLPDNKEDYKYPDLMWAAMSGLSILMFAPSVALIMLSIKGLTLPQIAFGTLAIAGIATSIWLTSEIFKNLGTEFKSPPLKWSATVGFSVLAFSFSFWLISKAVKSMNIAEVAFTTLAIVGIAFAIKYVAKALTGLKDVEWNLIPLKWAATTATALALFGLSVIPVGLAMKMVGPLNFLLGAAGLVVLAGTISLVAQTLNLLGKGAFSKGSVIYEASDAMSYFGMRVMDVLIYLVDKVEPIAKRVSEWLPTFFGKMVSVIKDFVVGILPPVNEIFKTVVPLLQSAFEAIVQIIDKGLNGISKVLDSVSGVINSIGNAIVKPFKVVTDLISVVTSIPVGRLATAAGELVIFAGGITTLLTAMAGTKLIDSVANTGSKIVNVVGNVADKISGIMTGTKTKQSKDTMTAKDVINYITSLDVPKISLVSKTINSASGVFSKLLAPYKGKFSSLSLLGIKANPTNIIDAAAIGIFAFTKSLEKLSVLEKPLMKIASSIEYISNNIAVALSKLDEGSFNKLEDIYKKFINLESQRYIQQPNFVQIPQQQQTVEQNTSSSKKEEEIMKTLETMQKTMQLMQQQMMNMQAALIGLKLVATKDGLREIDIAFSSTQ